MIKSFPNYALIVLASLALVSAAQAHTISIGVYNAGAPGSVTVSLGAYNHGAGFSEGSIQLISGPGTPSSIVPFTSFVTTQPVGLVDGVTNFYADVNGSTIPWGSLPSDSYNSPTNTVGLGPVAYWQEATFTGLAPGTYTYQLSGMNSATWNNINSYQANWTGTLVITDAVAALPEPASMLAWGLLTGVGLVGYRLRRRKVAA